GYGIARVPRVKGSRYPKANVAAFAPMTVGGRRAHPPKVDKITHEKINKKERIFAILSAISATASFNTVSYRGHLLSAIPQLPLIVSNDLEKVSTAKEFKEVAISLGLWNDIERVKNKIKIRAGKGKIRGRRYKIGKGPLIVVSDHIPLIYATKNFPGVEVIRACDLSVMHLAPGGIPGRLTVWTQAAIEVLRKRFFIYENKFLLKLNVFSYSKG
ncbi:MAG: 50S ribosomal protein L4, partial [Candidatus Jordarchaeaceae archaeon]